LVTLRAVARLSGIQAQALGSAAQAIFRAEIALVLAALPGAKKLAGHVNVIRVSDGTADSDTDEAELPAEEGGLAHLEYEVVGFEEVGELAAAAASLRRADAALVRQLRAYPEFASLVDVATEVMPWPSQPEEPQGEQTPRSSHTVTAAVIGSPSVIMIAVCAAVIYRRKHERQTRDSTRTRESAEAHRGIPTEEFPHPLGVVVRAKNARGSGAAAEERGCPDEEQQSQRHVSAEERRQHPVPPHQHAPASYFLALV